MVGWRNEESKRKLFAEMRETGIKKGIFTQEGYLTKKHFKKSSLKKMGLFD